MDSLEVVRGFARDILEARKTDYWAHKYYKLGDPEVDPPHLFNPKRSTPKSMRDLTTVPGYKEHEWSMAKLSMEHSMPTHHSLSVDGSGERFKKHMEKHGFRVRDKGNLPR
jgi:hypothetical protein